MSRYETLFAGLAARREIGLGAFVMLGDPTPEACLRAVDTLVAAGTDFLELGIPFSDPVADGPVIQAAADRARAAGVTTATALALVGAIRTRHPHLPIGLLTYANLVAARGPGAFAEAVARVGGDSLLLADVPTIEALPYVAAARTAGIAPVLIAAANTPEATLARIAELSRGYTYTVARRGVTGAQQVSDPATAAAVIARLRALGAPPPVLGFGIGAPAQVEAAAQAGAAGVICGSAIVERLHRGDALRPFVAALKAATRMA